MTTTTAPIDKTIRISYLYNNARNKIVACIATKRVSNSVVEYQITNVSDKDRFNRAVGRQLTKGRLIEKPITLSMTTPFSSYHDVMKAVVSDISTYHSVPPRTLAAAKQWLVDSEPDSFSNKLYGMIDGQLQSMPESRRKVILERLKSLMP